MTIRKTLTEAELEHVTAAAGRSWAEAVVETFRLFGLDLTDKDAPKVRPGDYEIPADQWGTIAQACDAGEPLERVNRMLDWMNYGPGSFDPDKAGV